VLTENTQKEGDSEVAVGLGARIVRVTVPWRRMTGREGEPSAKKTKRKERNVLIFDDALLDKEEGDLKHKWRSYCSYLT
jgi:hypothetical protein